MLRGENQPETWAGDPRPMMYLAMVLPVLAVGGLVLGAFILYFERNRRRPRR
jgi:hypothetical protein